MLVCLSRRAVTPQSKPLPVKATPAAGKEVGLVTNVIIGDGAPSYRQLGPTEEKEGPCDADIEAPATTVQ